LRSWPGGIDAPFKQKSTNTVKKESSSENVAAAKVEFRTTAALLLITG
jgi:hypothetical protein